MYKPAIRHRQERQVNRRKEWKHRMKIEKVKAVYFTGTGTTKQLVCALAGCLQDDFEEIDISLPAARRQPLSFSAADLVIFGLPVYAGRVPNVLLPFLRKIEGDDALAVPVVLYGNRAFDDALIELRDLLEQQGMHTVAAGAFVGQHAFSRSLAKGRPDAEDLAEAERLAQGVREKLDGMACPPDAPLEVDGTPYPYSGYYVPRGRDGEAMDIRKVHPATKDQCIHCGRCIRVCRMGSIDPSDPAKSTGICIKCGACIKACPVGAKYFSDVRYLFHIHDLEQRYARRGENKIFL